MLHCAFHVPPPFTPVIRQLLIGVSGPHGAAGVFAAKPSAPVLELPVHLHVLPVNVEPTLLSRRRHDLERARERRVTDVVEVQHQRVARGRGRDPREVELA